jgi:hypothetical protein
MASCDVLAVGAIVAFLYNIIIWHGNTHAFDYTTLAHNSKEHIGIIRYAMTGRAHEEQENNYNMLGTSATP